MVLFANKIIIFFSFFFWKKNHPSLLCAPNSAPHHATGLWKHPESFPPCRPFWWGARPGQRSPCQQVPPRRGCASPRWAGASNSVEGMRQGAGKTPQQLLFQSSFAPPAVTLTRPGVLQMCLLSPHRPSPPLASPLQSYIILHIAAAICPVFPIPLTLSHVPCSLQHPNALHVSYLIFLACQLGRREQMLVQK